MTVTPLFMVFKCMNSILSDLKHTNDAHFIPLTHFHYLYQETPTITVNVPELSCSYSTSQNSSILKIRKSNIKHISAFFQLMLESFSLILFLPNDGMGQVY